MLCEKQQGSSFNTEANTVATELPHLGTCTQASPCSRVVFWLAVGGGGGTMSTPMATIVTKQATCLKAHGVCYGTLAAREGPRAI